MPDPRHRNLQQILESGQPPAQDKAFLYAQNFLDMIETAHRQGKVFGGIYPDQIQLEPDGLVQVQELSIQRIPDDVTDSYLGFMPPEIVDGQTVSKQSDIYSAGIILYLLMTGRVPFAPGNREALTQSILQTKLEEFPKSPGLASIEPIIRKCLNRSPARRYPTVTELATEFRKTVKPVRPKGGGPSGGAMAPAKKMQRQAKQYQRLLVKNWKIAAGVIGLLVVVAVVWTLMPEHKSYDHKKRSWEITRLTTTTDLVEREPSLSPSGDQIAFISNTTANWDLYIRKLSGSAPVQLTTSPGAEENPQWNPDGDSILFTYRGPGIPPTIFSVPASGGIPQKLAEDAIDGQWSADGSEICYATPAQGSARSLVVLDVKNNEPHTILKNESGLAHPSFSGDGKTIVAESDANGGHGLILVDIKTQKKTVLTKDSQDFSPTWDKKSSWIYFSSKRDGNMKLYRVAPDGFVEPITHGEGQDFNPSPSFKGSTVLFFRQNTARDIFSIDPDAPIGRNASPHSGESLFPRMYSASSMIYIRNVEEKDSLESVSGSLSKSTVILPTLLPSSRFSTDGVYLYVESPQDDKKGLWQVGLTGGNMMGLGESMLLPYEMSPDKKSLLYATRQDANVHYMLKDTKTQEERELLQLPFEKRILRAYWVDRQTILFLTADHFVSRFGLKDGSNNIQFDKCFDFSLRPKGDMLAALIGDDLKSSHLFTIDTKTLKRREITGFDAEAYAVNLDWTRDGKLILYDRMRAGADLYSAE